MGDRDGTEMPVTMPSSCADLADTQLARLDEAEDLCHSMLLTHLLGTA